MNGKAWYQKEIWYGYICRCLRRYPAGLRKDGSKQSMIALNAISEALEETEQTENGHYKIQFITDVYIKHQHNLDVASENVFTSRRTAQRWAKDFIYLCAEKMGYR